MSRISFLPSSVFSLAFLLFMLVMPTISFSQCTAPLSWPDSAGLFFLDSDTLEMIDQDVHHVTTLHSYGLMTLAAISDYEELSSPIKGRLTPIKDTDRISYRSCAFDANEYDPSSLPSQPMGIYLLAANCPLDDHHKDLISATGALILDFAPPYGPVLYADGPALSKINRLCTSEGHAVVKGILPFPIECKMSRLVKEYASGKAMDFADLRLTGKNGALAVRIFPYSALATATSIAGYQTYAELADPEISRGLDDVYFIPAGNVIPLLKAHDDIAYIEELPSYGPSANIAMGPNVLNISDVWPDAASGKTGYDGMGIKILHTDWGVDLAHDDFCTYDPHDFTHDCSKDPQDNTIIAFYQGLHFDTTFMAHGTHTAGLLAGRGWEDYNSGINSCLCRPRPEDGTFLGNQNSCGETAYAKLPKVKGAAPGASLIENNIWATGGPSGGWASIISMMSNYSNSPLLSPSDARIGSNSWNNYNYDYNSEAHDVDQYTRDADNSPSNGNQEMLMIFSAGNNDIIYY